MTMIVMSETIEIALAANGGYFDGLFVTACSIAEYASKDVCLSYNILDGGIASDDCGLLERTVLRLHTKSRFNYIAVDEQLFAGYPKWNGNRMAYARLILPNALPDKDWVAYCDCDFLWMRDISELWKERDCNYWLIGTKDGTPWAMALEREWFSGNGFPFDEEQYFCSGLCVFNLKKFREMDLISKCQVIMSLPGINFPDQAALNVVTWGHVKLVEKGKWQRFTPELSQRELNDGTVIHYAGELPWKFVHGVQLLSDSMLLWHQFNARYRGFGIMRSLRHYFSLTGLFWHRGLCWLVRIPFLTQLVKFSLCVIGHRGVYDMFSLRARKFNTRHTRSF